MKAKKGFTLIELLVVIAIIALLLSILLPALRKVKDQAKRVLCMNNIRQCGMGLSTYAADNGGDMIPLRHTGNGAIIPLADVASVLPWRNVMAFTDTARDSSGKMKPLHLGVLYSNGYVEEGKVFYCAGQPRNTNLQYRFDYDYYTGNGAFEWSTDLPINASLGVQDWTVRTSYNFWTYGQKKLSGIRSYKPVILDNIYGWEYIPHRKRANEINSEPQGLSAWFPDGHVSFCSDSNIFSKAVWSDKAGNDARDSSSGVTPINTRTIFDQILRALENQ